MRPHPKNLFFEMDTFRFWKCQRDSMPLLPKLACTIISVPASATDVEKSWSAAELTVNKRRSKISSENLKAIILINRNKDLLISFISKLEIDTTTSDPDK